jgi:hypothetical protein
MLSWLNPVSKALILKQDKGITITLFLFGKKILEKPLKSTEDENKGLKEKDPKYYIDMAKTLKINHAKLYSSYGFLNPAITGVVCGLIDFISQYIDLQYLYNNADFFTEKSYFNVNVEAEINILVSVIRILKRKTAYFNTHQLSGNRLK